MSLHLSHCRKPGLLLSQGISGYIPLEAENTESLSQGGILMIPIELRDAKASYYAQLCDAPQASSAGSRNCLLINRCQN